VPQVDEARRLVTRLSGRSSATLREVVNEACALLGIPTDQIESSAMLDREVRFGPTSGIAGATDLQNDMDEQS
jgi:hypothetical protein